MLRSNDNWVQLVTAGSKRRYVFAGIGHATFGGPGVTMTPATTRLGPRYEHARRPPCRSRGPTSWTASSTPGGPTRAATPSPTLCTADENIGP